MPDGSTIVAGQLLLPAEGGSARIAPGYLRIEGEAIAEVVEGGAPASAVAPSADSGGPSALVCPGFIDCHAHLPQFEMIGAYGLHLLHWLEQVTFPTERQWEDPAYAAAATEAAITQFFSHGTTAACCYGTVHQAGTEAALSVASDRGLRGVIGQTLIDRNAPDYLTLPREQQIDETAKLLDRFPPGSRMAAAVTPRFAVSCTPELLADGGRLADEREAAVQSHLAETVPECELISDLFDGVPYTQVYRDARLLNDRSIYGHGIYLGLEELRILRDARAVIAHCPTANSFLRSGTMNRQELLAASVRVALGSDVGAGYERSMVRVGRAMIEAAATLTETPPNAAQAWHQITAGNAAALGWQDGGVLRAGDPADVVLIEPNIDWLGGRTDPLSRLMFAWDDRWVRKTWARGEVVHGAA
ncbi:MAG: amidohydrolase family protein [Planctomycetota bacterium]